MKKMLCAMLAVLCLAALAGCGSETVESNVPEVLKTVPTLTVHCGENSTEGLQGTHEWWYANGDGTQPSFIADSLHPLQCKDYMTPLTILPSTKSAQPTTARLEFSTVPDKVSARRWSVDAFCSEGEPVDDGYYEVLVYTLEPEGGTDDVRQFYMELPYGGYVYEVTALWENYEHFGGEVRYSFYTEAPMLRCTEDLCGYPLVEEMGDRIPMVMVDGELCLDTGRVNTEIRKCGIFDGEITSMVDRSESPTVDDQSNFGTGYGYQYTPTEGVIELYINEKWCIFATEDARQ